jgi:hypothetical protein
MEGVKIDDNTMEFDKPVTITYPKVRFERGYLEKQRLDIIAQRDEMIAAKERELAEVDGYLAEMDKAGIVAKPVEVKPVEPVIEEPVVEPVKEEEIEPKDVPQG